MTKLSVGVLGATGIVGQRLVSMLADHPWFNLQLVTASEKSVGKKYGEAVNWVIEKPLPSKYYDMVVEPTNVDKILEYGVDIVFSALPSSIAPSIEVELARKGVVVVSNASPMRMDEDIPLLNPEVNADHVELVEVQRSKRGWSGFIVKVPNCTTAILTLPLKPLMDEYGVGKVIVSTMQSLSGAGLRGVPSMLILDNIIPFIEGEEWKVENESRKILGRLINHRVKYADIGVTASCHRVMVLEGHLESVFVELHRMPSSLEEVSRVLSTFKTNKIKNLNLPSAPSKPIIVRTEKDRPQPRLDRMEGNGMSVVVGRIRADNVVNGVKFIVLGHNTIRGAAGTAVLIAELLVAKKLV